MTYLLPLALLLFTIPTDAKTAKDATFVGIWDTTYGRLRLDRAGDGLEGTYSYSSGSTITGKVEKGKFTFHYREPEAAGEGVFELGPSGEKFTGKWRASGSSRWQPWAGTRVHPEPGRVWLVVLESNWEGSLAEQEYAFGDMLRTFFARSAKVGVRHRWAGDAATLKRWCRELAYLPEPVVLVFAMHGNATGVHAGTQTVGAKELAEALKYARNLKLVHFSACQIMKGTAGADLAKGLGGRVPISGYTTSVDWAGSAVIEFTYLDLILMRGYSVKSAAAQVLKLLPFAGDKPIPGAAIRSAGFRLIPAERKKGEEDE